MSVARRRQIPPTTMGNTTSILGVAVSSFPGLTCSTFPLAFLLAAGFPFFMKTNTRRQSNIPKVRGGLPILGHAVEFGSNTKKFLERCRRDYGKAFRFTVMGKQFVVVDPSFQMSFFTSKTMSFAEGVRRVIPVRVTVGEESIKNTWHVPFIKSQFSVRNLTQHEYLRVIQTQVEHVLEEQLTDEVCNDPQRLAWNFIAACSAVAFVGPTLGRRKDLLNVFVVYNQAVHRLMEAYAILPESLLWLLATDVKKHRTTVRDILLPEIQRRKETGDMPHDMLSAMIAQGRAPEDMAERMMSFIMASMVTSAGVLTHSLLDLASPGRGVDERQALVAEQRSVVAAYGQDLTQEALDHMPCLKSFCWESMRTSNPAMQIVRWTAAETTLQSTSEEGLTSIQIPADCMVAMSGILIEQDKSVWGDTATEFHADRFLDKSTGQLLVNDPSSLGLLSFGAGRNICPGRHFAMAEVMGTLATVLRQFDIETVSGNVPGYMVTAASRDRAVEPVRFRARNF